MTTAVERSAGLRFTQLIGASLLTVVVLLALLVPVFAGDPLRQDLDHTLGTPTLQQPLGTGWLQNRHFNLFGGRAGLLVNTIGALLLVLMCLSGIVVWWPVARVSRRLRDLGRRAEWAPPRGLHRSAASCRPCS
jgi:hypothetical protein